VIEVTIERLGHQGDGITTGPVFVAQALPGEVVSGEVQDGRIVAPKIITPSADRVRPPCSHAKSCGGCLLQHASDEFVANWKLGVVETALAAQGLRAEMRPIVTSPPKSRRRATLSGRRTKKGALVGFHMHASDTIIQIPNCELLHPALLSATPALEALTIIGASRKSEISLLVAQSDSGIDVTVKGVGPADGKQRVELAGIAETYGLARLTWDDELIAQRFSPAQQFGSASVVPPPGAFLQATLEGEKMLSSAVLETISGAKHVVDLFAGCGTFSLPAAAHSEVHAVESDALMLAALDKGWRLAQGLKRVTTETRDLFRRPLMPDELKRFDAVVIDPPRAGAEAQVRELGKSNIPRIAMISCNPVTFARDAKHLVDHGYQLGMLQVVDQFRWSPHIELCTAFRKT
jgi:23S rRNA (uracil1939-C5)-methyltransferase